MGWSPPWDPERDPEPVRRISHLIAAEKAAVQKLKPWSQTVFSATWDPKRDSEPVRRISHLIAAEKAAVQKLKPWFQTVFERDAIARYFGLHEGHVLMAEASRWLDITEPQATKGLAEHVMKRQNRRGRLRAFLTALGIDVEEDAIDSCSYIKTEWQLKPGRIDLVIAWEKLTRFAVIEFKFNPNFTDKQIEKQLKKYKKIESKFKEAKFEWFFVTNGSNIRIRDWKVISISKFLLTLEKFFMNNPNLDDGVFRQFRREIWKKADGLG